MKKVRKTIKPKASKIPQTREIEASAAEKKIIPGELNFFKFGRTETGTPKVNEYFGSSPWINFGENNDFPQELMRLYTNASGIHRGIVRRKADLIAGQGFKPVDALKDFIANYENRKQTLNKIGYKCALDTVLFGGYYIKVIFNALGTIARVDRVPYPKVRVKKPCSEKEANQTDGFFISPDWLNHTRASNKPKFIAAFNPEIFKEYPEQILFVRVNDEDVDYYTLPDYMPVLNWIKLDYEISTFHLKQVQNGMMPGMIIINKMGIPPLQQREEEYQELKKRYSGSENSGDFIMVYSEGGDKAPEFLPVQLNDSDQRFRDLMDQIDSKVMKAHGFTSAVAGNETQGKLGSRNEIVEQLEMIQLTTIAPLQRNIEETFNELAAINGLPQEFELLEYRYFKEKSSDVLMNLNSLSPIILNRIISTLGTNEIREMIGLPPTNETPAPTPGMPSVQNEALEDVDFEKQARAKLKGTVGGVQGILSIKQSVLNGMQSYDTAIHMLKIIYGYSLEEAQLMIGIENPDTNQNV